MGFFSKDKITLDQLADSLANMVFDSVSENSLEPYQRLLKEIKGTEKIDERQKREILVFTLLAATRAVSSIITNPSQVKKLLDKLHTKIYSLVPGSHSEQVDFEKLVGTRYQSYYKILGSQEKHEDIMFQLGKQFTKYFLDKDEVDSAPLLIVASADVFSTRTVTFHDFIKETFVQFEITK